MSAKLTRVPMALAATLIIIIVALSSIYVISSKGKTNSVEQPQKYLNYGQLITMRKTTVYAELNSIGYYIDSGNWTGVRLGLVLEKTGLNQQAERIEFYASDWY